jgi:hypothetical protein
MLRFLILIITISFLFIVGIKWSTSNQTSQTTISKSSITPNHRDKNIKTTDINDIESSRDRVATNPSKELIEKIEKIFDNAREFENENRPQEALELYTLINSELNSTSDTTLIKKSAQASFSKAYIYKNYFHENDKAIETYNSVSKKFKESDDIELLKLYYYAEIQKTHLMSASDSIEIYNNIIKKFEKREEIELVKMYASAQFSKSYLLEGEDRLEVYDEIIEKLMRYNNKQLLEELSRAMFSKACILSDFLEYNSEAIEVYDNIIEKFVKYNDSKSQKYVNDALFSKSYILVSENKEESMEILDQLIKRHENSNSIVLTKNFKYSIVNSIELALITNSCDDEYRDLADKYLCQADTKPKLQMLTILKESQVSNQDEAVKRWKKSNENYKFDNWSFRELKKWNSEMEDSESKERIRDYLDEFMRHNSSYYITDNATMNS